MKSADLGPCTREFGLNSEEWAKTILVCGFMIMMGTIGFGIACYRSVQSGTPHWILLLAGPPLAGIAAYLLYKLRPRLLSLAVHQHGLLITERDGQTTFRWSDVTQLEKSVQRSKSAEVPQLLIKTTGEKDLLVNSLAIAEFDAFLATIHERATQNGLEWVDLGAQTQAPK